MPPSADLTSLRRIEEAALNAWPAHRQMLYDGWLVRMAGGYTKRANSVTPLYEGALAIGEKVAACEALYRAAGLPPIFRLTPWAPPALDALLAERGYTLLDPTDVLAAPLGDCSLTGEGHGWRLAERDEWLGVYGRLIGANDGAQAAHGRILAAIAGRAGYALLEPQPGQVAACALGVVEGALGGAFDVHVAAGQRRRGYGTALMAGLFAWARQQGAQTAYLQVMQSNLAAQRLYAKMGLARGYTYWYRIPPAR